jgi:hypothetical protein
VMLGVMLVLISTGMTNGGHSYNAGPISRALCGEGASANKSPA